MTIAFLKAQIGIHMKLYEALKKRNMPNIAEYHLKRADHLAGRLVKLTDWNETR